MRRALALLITSPGPPSLLLYGIIEIALPLLDCSATMMMSQWVVLQVPSLECEPLLIHSAVAVSPRGGGKLAGVSNVEKLNPASSLNLCVLGGAGNQVRRDPEVPEAVP